MKTHVTRLEDLGAMLLEDMLHTSEGKIIFATHRHALEELDMVMSDMAGNSTLTARGAQLVADYKRRQAVAVDAEQQVADLKAENTQLRKDIEHLRKIVKAATEYANAHFYAEPQWKLERLFEDMCSAMDTPQPKEDKQS